MNAVLDAAFWLSVAMLGMVGVVYALGYPYLNAVHDLMQSEMNLRSRDAEAQRKQIADQLVQQKDRISSGSLGDVARDLRKRETELRRTVRRLQSLPHSFSVNRVVFRTGGAFLAGCVLSTIAKALLHGLGEPTPMYVALLGGASVMAIAVGFWQLTVYLRNLDLLSTLLVPIVTTSATLESTWLVNQHRKVTITAKLERGRALHSVQILLYVPPGVLSTAAFNPKVRCASDHPTMPLYNCIPSKAFDVLKRDLHFTYDFDRLSCSKTGPLKLFYRIVTEEYASDDYELTVTVT